MKRFLAVVMMTSVIAVASAQDDSQRAFSHMGIGISVGTTAIGINVSSVLNPYLGVRAGINIWPKFKMKRGLHLRLESDGERQPGECLQHLEEVNAKLSSEDWVPPSVADLMDVDVHVLPKLNAGHVLLDYFPFPHSSSFHLSAGAHIGTGTVVNLHNRYDGILMPITKWNNAMVNPELQPVVEEYNLRRVGMASGCRHEATVLLRLVATQQQQVVDAEELQVEQLILDVLYRCPATDHVGLHGDVVPLLDGCGDGHRSRTPADALALELSAG